MGSYLQMLGGKIERTVFHITKLEEILISDSIHRASVKHSHAHSLNIGSAAGLSAELGTGNTDQQYGLAAYGASLPTRGLVELLMLREL